MLLGVPAMMLLLYGYALNFDVRHVSLAVEDRSRSAASRTLVASFVNSTYFDLVATLPAGTDLEALTRRRAARAILVIPEEFATEIAAGREAKLQLVLDGSDGHARTLPLRSIPDNDFHAAAARDHRLLTPRIIGKMWT